MESAPIKFGILGCARIARKLSRAITLSGNATVAAIGSRSLEKAAEFARENGFPESAKAYGSYDAVLDDPDVDAVYLPLPTSLHIKWAVLAARKHKHVLLEKPVALDVGELDAILAECESNGVQFMDATMWMHHPRTQKMKEFLSDSSSFGQLKSVNSNFTFPAGKTFLENDIRVKPDLDALGALGDAGWYCIRSILWAADFELPNSVVASPDAVFNNAGVISSCSASLQWQDGKAGTFHCSFLADLTQNITIVGTNATLSVHDYVGPWEEKKATFSTLTNKSGSESEGRGEHSITITTELPQEALMVREFCRLVGNIKFGGDKPEKKWPTLSRKTQVVVDAVKLSIDRGYQNVELMT
ncbi:Oxidoreductase family protein [Perilla frutescens var. hirtella]|uniref:Oxidoreductase family protein n=1 Tax=Perilla frutescens var. hirtella TaxID=608512 RepID=A0AAD4J6K7_PERFH|nr:Oxidoreductase family protein [Perilla frutescens var. hirtella]